MREYFMKERNIHLDDEWDVIVVGGGASGCAAATASAREGAKTLLLESTGCLGGMATSGLVPAFCPFTDGEKIIYNGIAKKILLSNIEGVLHNPKGNIHGHIPINQERLRRIYDDLVINAGVSVLFNTRLAAVDKTQDDIINTIIVSNKEGLSAYKAKVYIDCTGDGDLATYAGADYENGDKETGETMPPTLCFAIGNVDMYAYNYGPKLFTWVSTGESPIWDIIKSGKYPEIPDSGLCPNIAGPGIIGFNAGHLFDTDATNTKSVSEALIKGRKVAAAFRDALAEFHPKAFGNSHLMTTANLLGVRESRRIMGDYVLTIDDYVARRSFDDEISRNCYHADLHPNYEKYERYTSYEDGLKKNFQVHNKFGHYQKGESHGIPYRCLTPKGIKNLLVAGRQISCDRYVHTSIRVMPVCLSTGEAAGMAAAHAADLNNSDVHTVDINYLRQRLTQEGSYLPKKEI